MLTRFFSVDLHIKRIKQQQWQKKLILLAPNAIGKSTKYEEEEKRIT